jgi:hypothetical protein
MKKLYALVLTCFGLCNLTFGQFINTTVKTPTDVTVDALSFVSTEFTSSEAAYWNSVWKGNWDVEILANSTYSHNCHGYAWHMVDGGTTIWINDVDQYGNPINNVRTKYYSGSTPSYVEVSSNYREGLKVSYYPRDHSAVTTSDPNYLISKWSWGPLVKHNVAETDFYSGSQIRYYEVPLSGSTVLCTSSSQSLSTLSISGANYSWSGSNISISGSGNQVSATATGNSGSSAVAVDVYSPYSGTTVKAKKSVWLGTPNLIKTFGGSQNSTNPVSAGGMYYLDASSASPATSFNYNDYFGYGDISVSLYNPNSANTGMYVSSNSTYGYRTVKATATNVCGSYSEDFVFYLQSSYRAYPNPAKETFAVEFTSTENQLALPDELTLVSEKDGRIVRRVSLKEVYEQKAFRQGNKVDFDISDLARGTYYLNVKNARLEESKQTQTIRLFFE